ncbi:xylose isomerase-like [Amphibalanus amphitrite]|uniref:xylose isomerase-like n=1 Tax=Amphibalanus amphitrite TaxID=1232801 RepID=UPI001C901081|nr:xylose isomerase-like [Amphibalanus amphitrite]
MAAVSPAKRARKEANSDDMKEAFPDISPIAYRPDAPADETLVFRHYNASQQVMGRSMQEWLRFSVCYWHSFRATGLDPFGGPTITRPWDDGSDTLENAKRRMHAAFEFFAKLGNKYWTFHDRDIAPEGSSWQETNRNLDEMVELAAQLQKQHGIKLLWATCNLFSHPRYMNGAASNPDAHVFACAGAAVRKGLEVAHKLGAENFVFWGGREGFQTLLNTDLNKEMQHMANFFRMVVAYKEKIGFKGQLLIEPKPKEPTRHQYDYDAMTVIAFLKTHQLDKHFKLNIEPNHTMLAGHSYEHDVVMASAMRMLGSIDANTGSPDLGWDTDQFPMDVKAATMVMKTVIEQGGLQPGGLNFDAKVRRESTDPRDLFIGHVGAMDTMARGLKAAARLIQEGTLARAVQQRYSSYKSGLGHKISNGTATLEDCEAYVLKHGNPSATSGQQEHYETIFNHYVHDLK